ncbi:hypothetical protein EJ02DRAFT_438987 [Clathrospora elynae]|uniref:Uncharacterized protein n=1 Tax=Clathrospora elynae TaxID=706981 RepID=A0A6A5S849_9PLEO|nr:hypothetical protein EJ02DRAFT_438987 [Clathrospora elynae]
MQLQAFLRRAPSVESTRAELPDDNNLLKAILDAQDTIKVAYTNMYQALDDTVSTYTRHISALREVLQEADKGLAELRLEKRDMHREFSRMCQTFEELLADTKKMHTMEDMMERLGNEQSIEEIIGEEDTLIRMEAYLVDIRELSKIIQCLRGVRKQ